MPTDDEERAVVLLEMLDRYEHGTLTGTTAIAKITHAFAEVRAESTERAARVGKETCDRLALDRNIHDYGSRVDAAIRGQK